MNRWKTPLLRLIKPRLLWMILLTLFCVPLLSYLLYNGLEKTMFSYHIYVLSTYMVFVWAFRVPDVIKGRTAIYRHTLGHRYMTDLTFRGKLSLHTSTAVNLCYALFKLAAGIYYRSLWFGAIASYYICLVIIRVLLLRGCRQGGDKKRELQAARLCGCLLFLLTLVLSTMAIQMVVHGMGYQYPGILIFAVALYAFYSITIAIINLVRFRKLNSPVLSVSKVLSLATALVSMLSLQTAMFASFGGNYQFQTLMNALTGGAVCLLILLMAILMVVGANKEIKRMKD